jgi:hypothetical protein
MTYAVSRKIYWLSKLGKVIIKIKSYGVLFAHVTTVNVLTAEPTIPAKIEPNMAWFTTISGSTLPNQETALGTIRYPAEPIVKPIAQKIKIASALDILHPSESCSWYGIHHRAACVALISLIVNFYGVVVILLSGLYSNCSALTKEIFI